MKSLIFALVAALLMIGQVFTPAFAGTEAAAACGDTYTVERNDSLSKIASKCGVTLQSLISANPEIKDINKIYAGQVIRIKASASVPTTTPTTTPVTSGSEYTVVRGDTLGKIAARFGITVQEILRANTSITDPSRIYVGQVIKIPTSSTGRRVTLSATSAKPGAQVEVKVFGFPANADVDFRLGKQNAAYTTVYDAKTDAKGEATLKVTIPSSAVRNDKWVVKVLTTNSTTSAEITSSTITITN